MAGTCLQCAPGPGAPGRCPCRCSGKCPCRGASEYDDMADMAHKCSRHVTLQYSTYHVHFDIGDCAHSLPKLSKFQRVKWLAGLNIGRQSRLQCCAWCFLYALQDMVHLILCLLVFWTIARDKASEGESAASSTKMTQDETCLQTCPVESQSVEDLLVCNANYGKSIKIAEGVIVFHSFSIGVLKPQVEQAQEGLKALVGEVGPQTKQIQTA